MYLSASSFPCVFPRLSLLHTGTKTPSLSLSHKELCAAEIAFAALKRESERAGDDQTNSYGLCEANHTKC
jgi:hypothetical protein